VDTTMIQILLIEENLAEAGMIRDMLADSQKQIFSVQHVQYLAEGLALLDSQEFDVILTDLGLPDSQGLETALAVRENAMRTPIVVLTILDDEDTALKALQMDIQDYLLKCELSGSLLRRSIRYAIQRKRDSEGLRESRQRFESFMFHLPGPAWMKDLHGRYVYANAETECILNASFPQFSGKSDEEILPPETARLLRENDERVLVEGANLRTTEVLRDSAGIERHHLVSKFPVPGPEGRTAYVAGVAFDITDTLRLEAEVRRVASFPLMNPNPIFEIDVDGRLTYCNPAAEAIQKEMGCDKGINRFIPADLPAIVRELREEKPPCIHREVDVNGSFYEEAICLAPQTDTLRIYTMDITRRKKAEQERERMLLKFESVLNSIHEGVVIADLDGNIVTMNPAALAINKFASIEQVRQPLHVLAEAFELSELDGRPVPFDQWPLTRALRGERFADLELRVRRRDPGGSWVCSHSGTPVYNKAGDIILAVVTLRDITERKRTEEALQISEERMRYASMAADIGIWNWDLVKNDLVCNDRCKELFGYPVDYPPSYDAFLQAILEEERQRIDEAVQRSLREKTEYFVEIRVAMPDGLVRWVMCKGRGFYNESGVPVRMHGIAMDITGRRQAEEDIERLNTELAARAVELEFANLELDAFNYSVAHDLRKPLTTISCYCQVIRELCGDKFDKQCTEYLQEVYDGTLRMDRLITALLDFSRLAHVHPRRERIDLSSVAKEVAAELQLPEPERNVTFRISEGITVDGDGELLRVVVDNLLGNAWKYTAFRQEGAIEFGMLEIDAQPTCFVRDNGRGFTMTDADKLFTPFQRLPETQVTQGFGIGLATVARIIQRHGGRIWAEGKPGKGATFYFTLS